MPDIMPCESCGAQQSTYLFDNPDYLSGETFQVVRCTQCGLVRTVFPHALDDLGRYYGATYYGDKGRRFIPIMEWLINQFRQSRARLVIGIQQDATPGAVLDVGCGRGLMLIALRNRGWTCTGTELSRELAEQLRTQHGITVLNTAHLPSTQLPAASFDVITLWHSLEHTPYPRQTVAEISRLLKPGGHVVIEVPNFASWQARLGKGRWFHLDTPRHLYHFSKATLAPLLQEHGLTPTSCTTLSLEQGFYGMWQTLLNRVTQTPNTLYSLLKKQRPHGHTMRALGDIVLMVLLLPVVILSGSLLEVLAVFRGKGAVLRITAQKTA